MFTCFIISYVNINTLDVKFSDQYKSFNIAKTKFDSFIENILQDKTIKYICDTDLEKLRENKKNPDCHYIIKMTSESVIYNITTLTGTFYNTYLLQKIGKFNICEFTFQTSENSLNSLNYLPEAKIKDLHVTNYERGTHVSFVSELKEKLSLKFSNSSLSNISNSSKIFNNFPNSSNNNSSNNIINKEIDKEKRVRVPIIIKIQSPPKMDMKQFIEQLKNGKDRLKKASNVSNSSKFEISNTLEQ